MKNFIIFFWLGQLFISIAFLLSRILDGMPASEAFIKFGIAVSISTAITFMILFATSLFWKK